MLIAGCGGGSTGTGNHTGSTIISVRSNPSGAHIFLDGQDTGRLTPADLGVTADENYGTEHVVTLKRDGYNTWSGLATIQQGDTFTMNAALTSTSAQSGAITVQSQPSGARVYLDGADTGRVTPTTLNSVPASQHVLEFRLDGFHPYREEVDVAGGTAASAPTLTREGNGRVTGRVIDPEGNGLVGAQVAVRGTNIVTQTTTYGIFTLPNVPAGTQALTASITTGGSTLTGTREEVFVADGRLTSNADIVTAVNGASGSATGIVTNSRGVPIEGAVVFASQAVAPNFVPDPTITPQQTSTDYTGRFNFTGLPSGFWVFTAAYPDLTMITKGISPQIYVAAGATAQADFELPASTAGRPSAPLQLSAVAFTMPASSSRAPEGYEGIRDRLLKKTRAGKMGSTATRATRRTRTAPSGSLIEADLSWIAPNSADVIGFMIGRSTQSSSTGFMLLEDLLNPHAGLWVDYDQQLAPGRSFYYRVTAVNSQGLNSDPSNVAEAKPLDQITVVSPSNTATSTTPTFTWNALPSAFIYVVQVFDSFPERYQQPVWESDILYNGQTSVAYGGTALQHGKTYYWVVTGGNSTDINSVNGWSISRITPFTVQ